MIEHNITPISQAVDRFFDGEEILPYLIEVEIKGDKFLAVMETLTRIGITGRENSLHQLAHVLRYGGRYYIAHYSQLKMLNKHSDATTSSRSSLARTGRIAQMLQNWNMVEIINPVQIDIVKGGMAVIPHNKIEDYNCVTHFNFKEI